MVWILAAAALMIVAFVFDMGLMIYAVYALLGVVFLSRFVTHGWAKGIDASRKCDREEASIGQLVTTMLTVENRGSLPVLWCIVEDLLPAEAIFWKPPHLQVLGRKLAILRLRPKQKHVLQYQIRCNRRGYYQIGPMVLETGDFFGLHRRFKTLTEPHFVMVYPKTIPLDGYEVASRRPIGEIRMSYRIYEDPTRIAGIRQYEMGDPLNRVHWRATARTGELHSKVFEPSTIAGATVLVDFHESSFDPRHEPLRSELAVTAAASIANAVYQMGQQIGLISNGRDAADRIRQEGWASDSRTRKDAQRSASMNKSSDRLRPQVVPTRKGSEQMSLILEALAKLELTDGLTLPQLIVESSSRMPRDASVIAILTKVTPEISIALSGLAQQGYAVTALINVHERERFAMASGALLAAGVETRHLVDEESIPEICRKQVLLTSV